MSKLDRSVCALVLLAVWLVTLGSARAQEEHALEAHAYRTIEWIDLLPDEDLDALLNPPEYLNEIEDGSVEDQIGNLVQMAFEPSSDSRYEQALVSTNVISAFDGQAVRLPGFIVPLEFDDNLVVTEFFLVPYFGACLHVPPPPPNQIVYVKYEGGVELTSLEQPFWVSGLLTTDSEVNDMAHAAYSLVASDVVVYE